MTNNSKAVVIAGKDVFLEDGITDTVHLGKGYNKTNYESEQIVVGGSLACLLYTSPSPRDGATSRMPSSA